MCYCVLYDVPLILYKIHHALNLTHLQSIVCQTCCYYVFVSKDSPPMGAAKQQPTPTAQAAASISMFLDSF